MNIRIKKLSLGLLLILVMANTSCATSDIIIDDFESSDFNKWTVEGEAFGTSPTQGALPHQNEISGYLGKGLVNSFHGGDGTHGSMTSKEFLIERNYINFLLGGGVHDNLYIQLLIDGTNVYKTHPINEGESLQWMTWEVEKYKGKNAVIKIIDNQKGGWGHILIDHIAMSNTPKSQLVLDKTLSFNIDKKYLLIPICDKNPQLKASISVDGIVTNPPYDIRLAKQEQEIDYWVPIDVEKYKGKKLSLIFNYIEEKKTAISLIKQSDSFDFKYNEKHRPVYHFTPQYGWMNDPNGMVYHKGEYHLFYQHNPYGSVWGNMHWGHAISRDLKKWEYFPVALAPDSIGAIFSGSAVIDKNNTAGFGANALIAIYTSAAKEQTQSIAYSLDNGRTFTKYDKNPVLSNSGIVDFRDPKVFWHDASQKWVMSLATAQTITFYGSKNLKEWERLSEFGENIGGHGGVWECPDMFPLTYNGKTKWVLLVSINPGGPNGGSATQYFIGNFDGKNFTADPLPYPLWLDYGRDNYAGVTWSNVPQTDGRRIFIGWMSNWDYANNVPSVNFKSAMTIPRELKIQQNGAHLILTNYPTRESVDLRDNATDLSSISVDKDKPTYIVDKLFKNATEAYELEMTLETDKAESFNFKLKNKYKEELTFTFDLKNQNLLIDRSKSGDVKFSERFAEHVIEAPLKSRKNYKIRLLMDGASSELFVNEGEVVQTNLIFPTEPYNTLEFSSKHGTLNVSGKAYGLK